MSNLRVICDITLHLNLNTIYLKSTVILTYASMPFFGGKIGVLGAEITFKIKDHEKPKLKFIY